MFRSRQHKRRHCLHRKQLIQCLRSLRPVLVMLAFSAVAHAQGTMDFSGAQTLMGTFKTILDILKKAGGWHPGLYLKIDNAPYMELVIEAMDESGPMGLPAISVAHYGEQNGDLMRDPEMCFELGLAGGAHLEPTRGGSAVPLFVPKNGRGTRAVSPCTPLRSTPAFTRRLRAGVKFLLRAFP
jgi:hypothetical protein